MFQAVKLPRDCKIMSVSLLKSVCSSIHNAQKCHFIQLHPLAVKSGWVFFLICKMVRVKHQILPINQTSMVTGKLPQQSTQGRVYMTSSDYNSPTCWCHNAWAMSCNNFNYKQFLQPLHLLIQNLMKFNEEMKSYCGHFQKSL